MEDGYRLIDYGININDVIQLMIRAAPVVEPKKGKKRTGAEAVPNPADVEKPKSKKSDDEDLVDVTCEYYQVVKRLCFDCVTFDLIVLVIYRFRIWSTPRTLLRPRGYVSCLDSCA